VFPGRARIVADRAAHGRDYLLVGVRLSSKREVGQMTPFDLTLLLLLSDSVQNAMTGISPTSRVFCAVECEEVIFSASASVHGQEFHAHRPSNLDNFSRWR
jgi:hypothetical protein